MFLYKCKDEMQFKGQCQMKMRQQMASCCCCYQYYWFICFHSKKYVGKNILGQLTEHTASLGGGGGKSLSLICKKDHFYHAVSDTTDLIKLFFMEEAARSDQVLSLVLQERCQRTHLLGTFSSCELIPVAQLSEDQQRPLRLIKYVFLQNTMWILWATFYLLFFYKE